jgi:hypothetical protein
VPSDAEGERSADFAAAAAFVTRSWVRCFLSFFFLLTSQTNFFQFLIFLSTVSCCLPALMRPDTSASSCATCACSSSPLSLARPRFLLDHFQQSQAVCTPVLGVSGCVGGRQEVGKWGGLAVLSSGYHASM